MGPAPTWTALLALARAEGLRRPAKAAAPVGLGGDRWAVAVRTTDRDAGDDGRRWTSHLLIVDASRDPLRLVDHRPLVSWEEGAFVDPEQAPIAVFADDYDADGRPEVRVRFAFPLMLCGIGEVGRRELRIYGITADGHLRPQIALTLDDRVYFGGSTGRESFVDHDGDGRADLVVDDRSEYEDVDGTNGGRPIRAKEQRVFTYRADVDEYRAAGATKAGRAAIDLRIWDACGEGESPGSSAL